MRLFKDNLSVKYPDAMFLASSANEDDTEGDIENMGKKLADEVKIFLNEWCPGDECGRFLNLFAIFIIIFLY